MIGDGFKAHDVRHGPKLGQSLASGVSGLARRFGGGGQDERVEAARARVRAEIEARRSPAAKVATVVERVVAERGTGGEVGGIEAGAREFVDSVLPDAAPAVKAEVAGKVARKMARATGTKLGRPKVEGVRPWAAAGVSRRTWERRRKAGK